MRRFISVALALAISVGLTGSARAASPHLDEADAVVAYERDVFVIVGSTLRNPDETTDPSQHLFNVAGVALGRTWGEWQAADVTSTMRVTGNRTRADITWTGLIPGGVYSVFYGTLQPDSENPLCPGVERTLPLTSTDRDQSPDASSFVAAADGTAVYRGRVEGDLLEAGQVYVSLVYHLDGRTFGSLPNAAEFTTYPSGTCRSSFGEDAMRQALVLQKW